MLLPNIPPLAEGLINPPRLAIPRFDLGRCGIAEDEGGIGLGPRRFKGAGVVDVVGDVVAEGGNMLGMAGREGTVDGGRLRTDPVGIAPPLLLLFELVEEEEGFVPVRGRTTVDCPNVADAPRDDLRPLGLFVVVV